MKEKTIEKCIELFKEKNHEKTIKVKTKGKSMYPLIPNNSKVEVKIIPSSELKIGDIAMYYAGKKFFIHRILNKKINGFLVKGDNNWQFDSMVKEKAVIGKVTKINGKKIDSLGFKLTKTPVLILSYASGILSKIKVKK